MKIIQQSKWKYIIEMTKKEFDIFANNLEKTKLRIINRALAKAMVEALRGMKNIKKYRKELDELKKFGLKRN